MGEREPAASARPGGKAVHLISTTVGRLHVDVLGNGPPALLWHSLFADSRTWDRVLGHLAAHRTLAVVDGPSHGRSDPFRRSYDLFACAAAAGEVLEHLGVREPVDWVGNAWGGHVGAVLAASRPGLCRTLTLISTPVRALSRADRLQTLMLLVSYVVTGPALVSTSLTRILLGPAVYDSDPPAVEIVSGAFRDADRRGMAAAVWSVSLRRPDITGALRHVTVPVLTVVPADDPLWTVAEARAAARRTGHARLEVLGAGGHLAPLFTHPEELAAKIRGFWDEAP